MKCRSLWTQVLSRFKLGYTLCAMVEVHADLSPSAKTLPILAELVLRKLNLCPVGIAQITQTKTKVPHRRTQEGFDSGTASAHAGLLIPLRIAPPAVPSEQVRVTSSAAGRAAKQVCVVNCGGKNSTSRAIVQVSDWIRPHIASAPAMRPSASSSLRPMASARFSFQSRYGESLLHGFFRSERSSHPFLHVHLALRCGCAVGTSFVAAAPFAIHERHADCRAGPAGLLTTSRAVVAGWIRPQIASAYTMHPSAASSRRPGAAPACLACVSLQSRYGESSWQGYLRRVRSQHLAVSRQGNTHSLVDLAIAITMPCTCAVKFSLLFAWRGAKHLRDASCMFGPLTTSRAIVPVSGCICPPVSSAHAIRASAASSHRSRTAPICFSPQCRDGESLLHGFFRSERSCDPFLHVFKKVQLFLDLALCCGCAVGTSFVAAAPSAIHERHSGCMAGPAGLLATSRAVVPVAGWIRPQIASAYAMHPSAASSRRPGAAPACLACVSLQSRYGESSWQGYLRRVRSQHLVVSRQGNTHSLLDLAIAITMPCTCAVKFSLLFAWRGAKHLRDASCMSGPLTTSRAIVPVSGCICPPVSSAHAIRASAASSHRSRTAPICFSPQCRDGESLLHGFFRSERSCDPFLHVFKKVQLFLDLALCCGCAVGTSFVAAAPLAIHERHAGCMAGPAGLLATSRAVVLVAGWIRPQIASAYTMLPSAASSRRPGAAPACLACVSLQSRYGVSSWQGYLRRVRSQHLVVSRQGNTHSLLDLPIAITMPCTCAVKFSLLFAWRGAKHLRDASCMFGPLTTSRAIVPVSGCICPPVSSAHAIRASAASSHRSRTAPICFSPQCRDGESLLHGFFRSERSCDPFLHVFKKVQLFLDLAICCGCAVGSSFVADAPLAIHERDAGCVRSRFVRTGSSAKTVRDASCMSGPLTTGRATVPVSGWVRPMSASACASRASALLVGGAPVWIALQCRYSESVSRQEGSHDDSACFLCSGSCCGD